MRLVSLTSSHWCYIKIMNLNFLSFLSFIFRFCSPNNVCFFTRNVEQFFFPDIIVAKNSKSHEVRYVRKANLINIAYLIIQSRKAIKLADC